MAAPARQEVQIPRPSATLIIVNPRNEVLMVQRNPEARHFAGVTVSSTHSLVFKNISNTVPSLGISRGKSRQETG